MEQDDPFPFVVNPTIGTGTVCAWDVDDYWSHGSNGGSFAAGATASFTECVYADFGHFNGVYLTSPHPNIEATITFSNYAETQSFRVLPNGQDAQGQYVFQGCVAGPGFQNEGPWPIPIEGSNGGEAVPSTVTFTLRNLGAAIVPSRRDPTIQGQVSLDNQLFSFADQFCPQGADWFFESAPTLGMDPTYTYDGMEPL